MNNSGKRDIVELFVFFFFVDWFGLVGFFCLSLFVFLVGWLVGFLEKDGNGCAKCLVQYSSCCLKRKGRGNIQLVYVEFNLY